MLDRAADPAPPALPALPALPAPPNVAPEPLPDESAVSSGITQFLARRPGVLVAGLAALYAAGVNGQWRVGLDSAIYRGVGENLAAGRGYTFGGRPQDEVYPGLPVVIAAGERLFGHAVWPALALMLLATAGVLWVTYRLVRLHFPRWVAVTVVAGVGLNGRFLQQSQEVMTDVPFLLGVVAALYGWGRLWAEATGARRRSPGRTARSAALLAAGLGLAASMRPTFWILAASMGVVFAGGVVSRRASPAARRAFAGGLLLLVVVAGAWVVLDPRTRGFDPTAGGYERTLIGHLSDPWPVLRKEVRETLGRQVNALFFGQTNSPLGYLTTAALAFGVWRMGRREGLWAVLVGGTVAVTMVFSSVPRYYLMVLPLLWVAWLLALLWVARRVPAWASGGVLDGGILLVWILNIGPAYSYLSEQRAADFLASYNEGQAIELRQAADLIRRVVPPGGRVVGPYGSILTYYSGRDVEGDAALLRRGRARDLPATVAAFDPAAMVAPGKWYRDKDPLVRRMITRGVLRPGETIAAGPGPGYLTLPVLRVPPGDWQSLPDGAERDRMRARGVEPPPVLDVRDALPGRPTVGGRPAAP